MVLGNARDLSARYKRQICMSPQTTNQIRMVLSRHRRHRGVDLSGQQISAVGAFLDMLKRHIQSRSNIIWNEQGVTPAASESIDTLTMTSVFDGFLLAILRCWMYAFIDGRHSVLSNGERLITAVQTDLPSKSIYLLPIQSNGPCYR